ncbi:MAG: sterol desaturase family protein [bacterium]|nr:sterol desaturase family protein [bacterium]
MELYLRLGIFLGLFLCLALWESLSPKRILSQSKTQRWVTNLGILSLNSISYRLIFGVSLLGIGFWGQSHDWGIFRWLNLPLWLNFLLGIVILDGAVWFQHWVFHKVNILWRLHRVHHTDLDFDVTTGLRFHPLEIFPSMFFKGGVVLLVGIDPWAALTFEIILNGFSQFTHANVALNPIFERIFRWIFVTPDMHRIHHSTLREEHNRNFGFSFSFWDRLFKTYQAQPRQAHETMEIGIHHYRDPSRLQLGRLLTQPFERTPS